MIYLKLFLVFLQVGLFSVGGGYAAIPLIQAQVVDQYSWLSMNEFTDLLTIAEMTPGPIAINSATFVGIRIAGIGGALVATLGFLTPSLIIVSVLAYVYARYKALEGFRKALGRLRPVVVALIASAGISILRQVAFGTESISFTNADGISLLLFASAFFVLRKFKSNPIAVMFCCGLGSLFFDTFIKMC